MEQSKETKKKLTELDLDNIKKLYYEDKISFKKIGVIYNCSDTTINNFLKKYGVTKRISNSLREKLSDNDIENIKKLYYNELLSFSQISNIYKCSNSCICLYFKKHNLFPRTEKEANSNSWSEERKKNWSNYMTGKQRNLNKRWKISYKVNKNNFGDKNPMWNGGKTKLKLLLRNCYEYKQWRIKVFKRDNFTCQSCGDNSGGNLNAHHKISFSQLLTKYNIITFEDSINCSCLWDINNGITMCEKCHRQTDSYLYNPYNNLRDRDDNGRFNSNKIKRKENE
jgi:hypothetical protein